MCPEKQLLYWKTTTRKGCRQYYNDSKICRGCPRRRECFGASTTRRMVERHVWQDELDAITAFAKMHNGKWIYICRKQTIVYYFAEAKENHGFRYACMLDMENMREQCFLTVAMQNMKRLIKTLFFPFVRLYITPLLPKKQGGRWVD